MLNRNTTFTIGSKFIILITNFLLVIFSTHIWGSEGRGEIALLLANVSVIAIFSNIFCGSTVSFHAMRFQREFLLITAFTGALIVSAAGSALFSLFFGFRYFLPLFFISLLLSLTTAISAYWLGKNKIKNYNSTTILIPVAILGALIIIYFLLQKPDINTYFQAYYFGTGIAFLIGISGILAVEKIKVPQIKLGEIKSILKYGVSNEFNYLIQFLNYRLAYYFIAKTLGLSELGIFSIVISVSEAVWIISRSFSVIHYSNVIHSEDKLKNQSETNQYARQSLVISLLILLVSVFIPQSVYGYIFGEEFVDVGKYVIYLIPGVLAIAVSNLYGHYFAGIGKLNIVRNKSLIGLGMTIVLLPLLMYEYQLTGVCIALNASYISSGLYLYLQFKKDERA